MLHLLVTIVAASRLPKSFFWGGAVASYQVEGAFDEDGRSPSIWDTFSKLPNKTIDGSTGDVSIDQYHRYQEDFNILKDLGADTYRMSISWSRLIPGGIAGTQINSKAVQHYRNVFDALLKLNIEPYVTLYHWDLPQVLHDSYGGFLDTEKFNRDFEYYASTCFELFGDQVKNWMTFNEPHTYCKLGFGGNGIHAPGRCSNRETCPEGDSGTEVWRCGHSTLIAHANAVNIYRKQFQAKQKGKIAIVINSDWLEPLTTSQADKDAANRGMDFMLHWLVDPILGNGDYPKSMKRQLGKRLPQFTKEQSLLLRGSVDYIGLNHYTSAFVSANKSSIIPKTDLDGHTVTSRVDINGTLIGRRAKSSWLYGVAWGFKKLLVHIKNRYNNPELIITEQGWSTADYDDEAIHDTSRVQYYQSYLESMVSAMLEEGCNIKGYFAWSLCDNFEWAQGYTERFGIVHVDFHTQKRTIKDSARFLSDYFNRIRSTY
jgi:beta-glucosidase